MRINLESCSCRDAAENLYSYILIKILPFSVHALFLCHAQKAFNNALHIGRWQKTNCRPQIAFMLLTGPDE